MLDTLPLRQGQLSTRVLISIKTLTSLSVTLAMFGNTRTMPCCSITNQRLGSPGACNIATGACIDIGSKTWLVVTVMAAGGGGGRGGGDGPIEAVSEPPPQDDNNRTERNESTDRNPVNRPSMSCPCLGGSVSSIAPFGANSQCQCIPIFT